MENEEYNPVEPNYYNYKVHTSTQSPPTGNG